MKIKKNNNGVIVLNDDNNQFITAIPGGQYVHLHPRNADAVFVSERSDSQDDTNRVVVLASSVTEAFGTAFKGDRLALAKLLSENF